VFRVETLVTGRDSHTETPPDPKNAFANKPLSYSLHATCAIGGRAVLRLLALLRAERRAQA